MAVAVVISAVLVPIVSCRVDDIREIVFVQDVGFLVGS